MGPEFDDKDASILEHRMQLLNAIEGPRVGDFVRFSDGTLRRISYMWVIEPETAQTSDCGSYYLGNGYISMSGSLRPSVPVESLIRTDETRMGAVWFFHHDFPGASCGVYTHAEFRVYTCDLPAP